MNMRNRWLKGGRSYCGSAALVLLAACVPSARAADEPRQLFAREYFHTFAHNNAVLERIKPGEVIFTRTLDSGGQDEKSEQRSQPSNPLTGPFYVEGAEKGDAIKPDLVRKGSERLVRWDINLARGTVRLREPVSKRTPLEFPARPMLGCVGVAAPGEFAPTSEPAGSYGGNLDYNQIGEGATVILPVYHPGALLFMGDGHALMADGEPTGTGVETSMDVEFSVDLIKKAKVTGPRVETADYLISVGAQPEFESSLDRALQLATTDMVEWLANDYQMEPWAAHMLVGFAGKYDVVTIQGTMALRIPKRYLPARP